MTQKPCSKFGVQVSLGSLEFRDIHVFTRGGNFWVLRCRDRYKVKFCSPSSVPTAIPSEFFARFIGVRWWLKSFNYAQFVQAVHLKFDLHLSNSTFSKRHIFSDCRVSKKVGSSKNNPDSNSICISLIHNSENLIRNILMDYLLVLDSFSFSSSSFFEGSHFFRLHLFCGCRVIEPFVIS
jgi:hypothetical protein